MRRSISAREVLARKFDTLTKYMGPAPHGEAGEKHERMLELIADAREMSLSFAQAMPPIPPVSFRHMLDTYTPARIDAFVLKHLQRQMPYLGIEFSSYHNIAERAFVELKAYEGDTDFDVAIKAAAQRTVEAFPGMAAPAYCVEQIESLFREALGLDGTMTDPDIDDKKVLDNARRALDMISAPVPVLEQEECPSL